MNGNSAADREKSSGGLPPQVMDEARVLEMALRLLWVGNHRGSAGTARDACTDPDAIGRYQTFLFFTFYISITSKILAISILVYKDGTRKYESGTKMK